jgi:hypothetical protein
MLSTLCAIIAARAVILMAGGAAGGVHAEE